ncbi:alpha/beta fold hydrolase [Ramlibacter sp. PS3R-8]|uniref:alpha/beta fold hydrolase n=1 Tax=Ramlibacter sp. PS3R-8 TaxID=3133437 RepID=UPI0030ACE6AA
MYLLLTLVFVLLVLLAAAALFTRFVARKVEKSFPPTGEWIEVEGERIHYRRMGRGPAIVLVHGLGGQSGNFNFLPLQELAQRWTLVLPDRPGSGYSPRRDDTKANIAAQARLVAAFIRALRLESPPLLVGHSLGGAIALSVGLQDPACIAGLALIAPLTHFNPHVPAPFRGMAIRTPRLRSFIAHTVATPLAILNTRAVLEALFAPHAAPADFALRGGGLYGLRPAAFYGAATDMVLVEADLPAQQERYGELRMPVDILYGEGDRVLDWRAHGEALRDKVPQARLKVIPGGHMILVTEATGTAAWLEECARAAHGDLCKSAALA